MVLSERSESKGYTPTMYFVYILRTRDDALYIGVAQNLNERTAMHNRAREPTGPKFIAMVA